MRFEFSARQHFVRIQQAKVWQVFVIVINPGQSIEKPFQLRKRLHRPADQGVKRAAKDASVAERRFSGKWKIQVCRLIDTKLGEPLILMVPEHPFGADLTQKHG